MQINQGESSILAYFPTSEKAQEAAKALQNAGFGTVQVDRIGRFGVSRDASMNNAPAGRADTNTGLTLFSDDADGQATVESDSNIGILLGADPSVEGYASEGYGAAGGKSFLVTVVTDVDQRDQAASMLKDMGAYL